MEIEQVSRRIEAMYVAKGYDLGWRLLAGPWSTLEAAKTALITMNPGGKIPEAPLVSVEEGSAYVVETWGAAERGQSQLQVQIQKLFKLVGADPVGVLSGYFVPFRSPGWSDLDHKEEALAFGTELWRDLLGDHRPQLTLTLGRPIYERMRNLLAAKEVLAGPAGWGAVQLRASQYQGGVLIGLPHLSRFALMGDVSREENLLAFINAAQGLNSLR